MIVAALGGLIVILIVLWDAFETIVLPRTVTRRVRLTRLFYRSTWRPWSRLARLLPAGKRRESYLSFFGPLSLLLLLSVWATGLVIGFGLVFWGTGSGVRTSGEAVHFSTDLYLSG